MKGGMRAGGAFYMGPLSATPTPSGNWGVKYLWRTFMPNILAYQIVIAIDFVLRPVHGADMLAHNRGSGRDESE